MSRLRIYRLGTLTYDAAYRWQIETEAAVRAGAADALALLQHPPTISLGRRARPEHLLLTREELERRGAAVIQSDRGGEVTYHGPGQLVAYPILNLRRRGLGAVDYVRALEQTMLDALQRFGLHATRIATRPGVWLHGAKIGAVGVRIRDGVTTHGFALNVACDLSWFETIVPCGIEGAGVTSMDQALGDSCPGLEHVEEAIINSFTAALGYELASEGEAEPPLPAGRGMTPILP